MVNLPMTLLWLTGSRGALFLGKEKYTLGEVWWLVTPLAVLSIVAVFRLGFGHRDWFAPVLAGGWAVIGVVSAVSTGQYSLLVMAVAILLLITSGTVADRRYLSSE